MSLYPFFLRDQASSYISANQDSLPRTVDLLSHLMTQPYTTGALIEQCCQIIHRGTHRALDAETAMELHDVMCSEDSADLISGRFGLTSKSSSLLATSVAFAAMLLQEDYAMFFGAESPYVSSFMEFTERLGTLAKPTNVETSRLHSAMAVDNMKEVFR